jgi:cytochrome P450
MSTEVMPTPIAGLSLYHLLDTDVMANPYPLYHRLRTEDPVHWDPYLQMWLVTRYADVLTVLLKFSAARSPSPEQLTALGLYELNPIAQVMVRQMIFTDPPAHTRLRALAAAAFAPARVENLRQHIQDITNELIDAVLPTGRMDRDRRADGPACERSRPVEVMVEGFLRNAG